MFYVFHLCIYCTIVLQNFVTAIQSGSTPFYPTTHPQPHTSQDKPIKLKQAREYSPRERDGDEAVISKLSEKRIICTLKIYYV